MNSWDIYLLIRSFDFFIPGPARYEEQTYFVEGTCYGLRHHLAPVGNQGWCWYNCERYEPATFEEVLEAAEPQVRTELLFHLDIFNKCHYGRE